MIHLGLSVLQKKEVIRSYCEEHGIQKVVIFSPEKFRPDIHVSVVLEHIEWAEIIMYRSYYRLLQEINPTTLLVINECLRTQNRSDLTYNCLRNFLNQTPHQIIFQYLPLIDTKQDFMVLYDFDTRSRWKRSRFGEVDLGEADIHAHPIPLSFKVIPVQVSAKIATTYAKQKASLLTEVRNNLDKDPHNIPRNLLLTSGKAKAEYIQKDQRYVGRNKRLKLPNMDTYRDVVAAGKEGTWTVLEFCHNFIDFADFLTVSRMTEVPVMVADTKADRWYLRRYQEWLSRIQDAYTTLQR